MMSEAGPQRGSVATTADRVSPLLPSRWFDSPVESLHLSKIRFTTQHARLSCRQISDQVHRNVVVIVFGFEAASVIRLEYEESLRSIRPLPKRSHQVGS